ncbi:MAG: peptide-methionine (S)-S-oxide reductase MsrA [Opitutales bacterium]
MQAFRSLSVIAPLLLLSLVSCSNQATSQAVIASEAADVPEHLKTIVVGAGCFWCVEAFFERIPGVEAAISGYAGGSSSNPTYKAVSSGRSDHVEVVQVHYDPSQVSLRELIDFFWTTHDVSDGRGVYPDYGPQYRSLLLYQDAAQKAIIEASRSAYIAQTSKQVATELKQLDTFYTAEAYHQDFAKKHPQHPYIQGILVPKLKKLGFSLE